MRRAILVAGCLLTSAPLFSAEPCVAEYERGRREAATWGEMLGVVEGVLYGHSLTLEPGTFCLAGTPKEKVQAIAKTFWSEAFIKSPLLLDDVPTKEQAAQFLKRFFPCDQKQPKQ